MEEKKLTGDAFDWAYEKYIANDPAEVALFAEERIKADIGQAVYDLRNQTGLSSSRVRTLWPAELASAPPKTGSGHAWTGRSCIPGEEVRDVYRLGKGVHARHFVLSFSVKAAISLI